MKAAFTLIELIVVMAVLAILVLLAAPKFLNYTEKARASQAVNDIKTLETKLDEYLIRHEELPESFTDGTPGGGQLYDRTGEIDTAPDNLKVVDKTFYPESTLPGHFYTTDKGDVIYEDSDAPTEGGGVSAPDINKEFVLKPVSEEDKDKPLQGDGTESNPYRIWYLEHLKEIEGDMTGHYVMMRDLDFDNAESYLNPVENMPKWSKEAGAISGWYALGKSFYYEDTKNGFRYGNNFQVFTGHLDGQDYSIYNLFIDRSGEEYDTAAFALFGEVTGGTIQNISVLDAFVNAEHSAALLGTSMYSENLILRNIGISGEFHGSNNGGLFSELTDTKNVTIENIRTNVLMHGDKSGGLLSYIDGSGIIIRNIQLDNEVHGDFAGGLAAMMMPNGLTMEFIEGKTVLFANESSGGLVGESTSLWGTLTSVNKVTDVNLEISINLLDNQRHYKLIGGLWGYAENISLERISAKGNIYLNSEKPMWIKDVYFMNNSQIGGIIGYGDTIMVMNDIKFDGNISAIGVGEEMTVTYPNGKIGYGYPVDCVGGIVGSMWNNKSWMDYDGVYMPPSNIVAKGDVYSNGAYTGGIFGEIEPDSLLNVTKEGGTVTGMKYVGGIIGVMHETPDTSDTYEFTGVSSTANVIGEEYVGDIHGYVGPE